MATQVLNHTYRHFTDLQMSAKEFYDKLEKAILYYEFPKVAFKRKDMATSGFFSIKREYLIVSYSHYTFYVCASPYGRSYFISWWFQYERSSFLDWLYRSKIMSALFEDKEATMFRKDTQLMFQNSINSLVSEVSATVQPAHGTRLTAPLSQQQLS